MKEFFHFGTGRYKKRIKYILGLTLLPIFILSVIAVLVILVNLRSYYGAGYFWYTVCFIMGGVLFGILFTWGLVWGVNRYYEKNTRFTFIDVGLGHIVYSKYSGEYIKDGERIVLRRLYVIPLKTLSKLGVNEKSGEVIISCEDIKIRCYHDRDERLLYHFSEDKILFESWWYDENGFEEAETLVIPHRFGSPEILIDTIVKAKKRLDEKPAPKKYVHVEPEFVKKKKALKKMMELNQKYY